jgi:hypothetical protein
MVRPEPVDFEFEREGKEVTISARSGSSNFVMTMPLAAMNAFVASAERMTIPENDDTTARFQVKNATLEVSK